MSTMNTVLRTPDDVTLPAELELAWQWMEEQGWGLQTDHGYFLTPYAGDEQLGIVFTDQATLDGWFEPGSDAAGRLVPLAEAGGDGSVGALWVDDEGRSRFVVLGSDGETHLIADSAIDFLRLIGVGYAELTSMYLGDEPDEPESVDAVAEFRAWVEATFGVTVPTEWPAADTDDEFADWVRVQRGEEPPAATETPDGLPAGAVTGDVATVLEALGDPEGAVRLATMLELPDASARSLRGAGIELKIKRGAVQTIWVSLAPAHGEAAYPRPERMFDQFAPSAGVDEVIAHVGAPEQVGDGWVRFVVGDRYLHLTIDPDVGITLLTAMVEAP